MSLIITQDRGRVRHVVLNRPDKRNALSSEMAGHLAAALREAAYAQTVDCIVLSGEGPVFSAGIDLNELQNLQHADFDRSSRPPIRPRLLECANLCEETTKPVICQIHGACLGAALEIAIAADFRLASTDTRFALPEVKLGIVPDVGGSSRLPALVGLGAAKELIMTGRPIEANRAYELGLVTRVVEPAELVHATDELVEELLSASPAAGRAKRILDSAAHPALNQTLELELVTQEFCLALIRERAKESAP